jgi:hypothetical protein
MVKILTATIKSFEFYGRQEKRIEITVEGEPQYIYRKIDVEGEGTAYLGEDGGIARFFFHNPRNERGFCGANYVFEMVDGTMVSVRGPWSSSASSMNKLFQLVDPLVEVVDVTKYTSGVVAHVRKSVLDAMGVPLKFYQFSPTCDGYWVAA